MRGVEARRRRASSPPIKGKGDCVRCCVAFVLNLRWQQVPDFVRKYHGRWPWHLAQWLRRRGLFLMRIQGRRVVDWAPRMDRIACGTTRLTKGKKGTRHALVINRGKTVYDPSPKPLPLKRHECTYLILRTPR